ncbi:hypothetical protein Tco_1254913 [Tanacetum coccineum]
MTPTTTSSGLVPNPPPSTPFVPPLRTDWDILFQPLFDELLTPPPSVDHPAPEVITLINEAVAPEPAATTGSPSSTTVNQDAPSPSNSQTTPETQSFVIHDDVEEDDHDLDVAHINNNPFFGIVIPETHSEASSFSNVISNVIPTIVHTVAPYSEHVTKWTKDHPLDNIIGELERPVWELVPRPDKVMVITLKWIYKVKLDELGVARLDAIQIFLAYGCNIKNDRLQIDCKDAIHERIMPKRLMLDNQDESLKKYGMESSDLVDTPMVEKSKLDEDTQGKVIDPTHYHEMIGTLMYLTASRPDLTFDVCMCVRLSKSADHVGLPKITRQVLLDCMQLLETNLLAGIKKANKHAISRYGSLNILPMSTVVSNPLDEITLTDYGLNSRKFQ